MKALKTITALLLVGTLAAALIGCGDESHKDDDTSSDTSSFSETDGAFTADGSVYDSSAGLDENGFFEGVIASEIITLPNYKGVSIPKTAITATDEAVEEQIDALLANYDTYEEIIDRAVATGDVINIDYVGYIDGVQLDGANTGKLGKDVTVGSTEYADGFININELIGHMPGETVNIKVVFPDDYEDEKLAGATADFEVTINYIRGELIKATLTDEIAKQNGQPSVDALVEDIKDWLVSSERFYLFKDILSEATCSEVPQSVIDYFIDYDISQHEATAYSYGYSTENYLKYVLEVESIEEYVEANMDVYKSEATLFLAAQAIAETENISVSSEDIVSMGYTQYVAEFGEPYLKQFILFQEILPTFIVENGVVEE